MATRCALKESAIWSNPTWKLSPNELLFSFDVYSADEQNHAFSPADFSLPVIARPYWSISLMLW